MSIAAYFGKEVRQLRIPKEADEAGIQYEGKVLRGESSVELARACDATGREPQMPAYGDVEDYDPVLLWHCRLGAAATSQATDEPETRRILREEWALGGFIDWAQQGQQTLRLHALLTKGEWRATSPER